jgi:hypothetical protein
MKNGDKVKILESATESGLPPKYIGHTATFIKSHEDGTVSIICQNGNIWFTLPTHLELVIRAEKEGEK